MHASICISSAQMSLNSNTITSRTLTPSQHSSFFCCYLRFLCLLEHGRENTERRARRVRMVHWDRSRPTVWVRVTFAAVDHSHTKKYEEMEKNVERNPSCIITYYMITTGIYGIKLNEIFNLMHSTPLPVAYNYLTPQEHCFVRCR